MNDTATQQGAAPSQQPVIDPDVDTSQEIEIQMSPRDKALAAMAERQEELHTEELQEALDADPGLAHQQRQLEQEIEDSNAQAREDGLLPELQPPANADGAASREPMHEPEPTQQALPAELAGDPLADFIEMHNGVPYVPQVVNGEKRLLTLDAAKRQLQIGTAAEVRMQAASAREQRIDERERRLNAGEAALSARMATVQRPQTPATPAQPAEGLSDEDLESQATEIFETAFSGTEEDAAKKLAKTLRSIRDSAARSAPTQQVDTGQIARQAASMAVGTLTAQSRKKDMSEGFVKFRTDYPDIVGDPRLFKMADDMTDEVEREHPDWSISQIMDEAGKRTRAWVKGLADDTGTGDEPPPEPPGDGQNSPVSDTTTQTRQERKAGLVRMPTAAGAAVHTAPEEEPAGGEQSPQEAFRELKAARGQPV